MNASLPIAPRPTKPHVASRAVEVEKNRAGLEEAEAARHTAEPICLLLIVLVVVSADSCCLDSVEKNDPADGALLWLSESVTDNVLRQSEAFKSAERTPLKRSAGPASEDA